jgi:hypothetical protein
MLTSQQEVSDQLFDRECCSRTMVSDHCNKLKMKTSIELLKLADQRIESNNIHVIGSDSNNRISVYAIEVITTLEGERK